MLNMAALHAEEEKLRAEIRRLDEPDRQHFYHAFEQRVKDPDTYAVLNYLFISGLHHFYLRRWGRGALNLTVFVAAILLMLNGLLWVGIALLASITLVELYALFRAQAIVQHYNNQLMRQLLVELKH